MKSRLRQTVKGWVAGTPIHAAATTIREKRAETTRQTQANRFWDGFHRADAALQTNGSEAGDPIDYTRHAFLYAHSVSVPLTGVADRWWLDEIGARYLSPAPGRLLALGCGLAQAEEHLLRRDYAREVIAYDASAEAIQTARARLATTELSSRIELRCGDPLEDPLEAESFDAVFVEAALHHFLKLEDVFRLIHRVLRKDGLFIFDEYVGPDHHQYPTELVELLNRINACLADRYRRDFETGMTRELVERASFESVLATDPSEGVHASQILPLTYQYFHVVDRRDYGGTVLRPLFSRILRSWNFDDVKDQTVARLIVLLEQEMIARGALPTHNAVVVARPRLRPRPPLNGGELERIAYVDWPGLQGDARFT